MARPVDATELAIVLLSALLHAGWSIAIKGSRDGLAFNLLQTAVAATVGVALIASVDPTGLPKALWPLVAATAVAHGFYLFWLSRALEEADISLVYPIARSTPAFLPLFAVLFLGESVSWPGALGIATVVAGLWLAAVGPGLDWRAFLQPGMGFAYLTLLTTIGYGVFDKSAMVHLDHADWTSPLPRPIYYFFLQYTAGAFVHVPLCLFAMGPAGARVRLLAVARNEWRSVGLAFGVGLAGYALILQALRTAPVSYVVAVRQASVFFVLALSVLQLKERPGRQRIVGASLTVAGVALIALAP